MAQEPLRAERPRRPHQDGGAPDGHKKHSGRGRGPGPAYAAIDLGTNNCRMLIARKTPGGFRIIDAFSRIVRLGEGLNDSGALSDAASERVMEALKVCAEKMERREVVKARCIATQACRTATNGPELMARIRDELKLDFDIITAEEEARLAVLGCLDLMDESFDAVTCRIAPHHFLDIEKAVAEIARVLRPRGVFVLEDSLSPEDVALDRFINEVEKLRDPTHVRAYNESEWREMLRSVGFKIKKTRNYRKTHEIQDWMDKASLAADQQPLVLDAFRSADEAARLEFEIKFEGDLPVSYTDNKIILRAVKA